MENANPKIMDRRNVEKVPTVRKIYAQKRKVREKLV